MPLHPVPIIIGTTLAVIGGGYAFKKFVYDPHVAPFIEALLASHQRDPRRAVPVPVHSSPSHASSTARRDRGSELRRRRTRSNEQEREALLSDQGPSHLPVEYELREKRSSESFKRDQETWGKPASYELKDATLLKDLSQPADTPMDENAYRRTKMKRKLSDPEVQLIQLDSPEVLFSASSAMASTPVPVPSPDSPDEGLAFSTLSFDTATDHWANVESTHEDDVLSLADTSTSGYEDAETYSPVSGARTPARLHLSAEGPSGLGINLDEPRRGPLSVVSLSESEGWAESDWATGSEAGI